MRQYFAVFLIALACVFAATGCGASITDTTVGGSITTVGMPLSFSLQDDETTTYSNLINAVEFRTNCTTVPTSTADCPTLLGTSDLTLTYADTNVGDFNYGFEYQASVTGVGTTLPAGSYAVYAFVNGTTVSNATTHVIAPSIPVTPTLMVTSPNAVTFGAAMLQVTITPFPTMQLVNDLGTVSIYSGGSQVTTCEAYPNLNALGAGYADCYVFVDLGSTQFTAQYAAPAGFVLASTTSSNTLTINAGPSTPSLTLTAASPVAANTPVTLTATLAPTPQEYVAPDGLPAGATFAGYATPGASVTFTSDGSPIGTGTLGPLPTGADDAVVYTLTTTLPIGSHNVVATYNGNSRYSGTLGSTAVTVNGPPSAAVYTQLTTSKSPAIVNDSVTFVATVSTTYGVPTGTVTFLDASNAAAPLTLGTVTVVASGNLSSTATFTTSSLPAGDHVITAVYNGDSSHPGGPSASVAESVTKVPATITLASSVPSSVYGQPVAFHVNVVPTADGYPLTGTLTVVDSGVQVGVASGGTLSVTTRALPVGVHHFTASYTGDPVVQDASADLTQVVALAKSAVVVAASSSTSATGANVTFTAAVSAVAPGAATPNGTVTFLVNGASIGSATVGADGSASFATTSLAAGSHVVTAHYAGNSQLAAADGTVTHTVAANASTMQLVATPASAEYGTAVTIRATIAGNPGDSVAFTAGGVALGNAPIDGDGGASLVTTALPVGSNVITATYAGDGFYGAASGSVAVVIAKAHTTTTLAAAGQTLTVHVTSTGTVTPAGSVQLVDGTTAIATATLAADGTTTFPLTAGAHALVAIYQGSPSFEMSNSATLTEAATPADAGTPAPVATTPAPTDEVGGSGGCATSPNNSGAGSAVLGILTILALRRRKKAA